MAKTKAKTRDDARSALIPVPLPLERFGPVMMRRMDLGRISQRAALGARLLFDGAQRADLCDSRGKPIRSVPAAVNLALEYVADAFEAQEKV